jgi:integrase/recombinase XerC
VSREPAEPTRMLLLALVQATQSYAERPLGAIAARYIRWLRNERGATASTVRDYEGVLGRVVVLLDEMGQRELEQVTTDDLRLVIDGLWGEREPRTRAKVTTIVRSFLEWCVDERLLDVSPAARIRRPKLPQKAIPLLPEAARDRLLAAAPRARDVFALSVLLDLGVRRNELRLLRVRDVDLARRLLVVTGKGQKARALPLRGDIGARRRELHARGPRRTWPLTRT